MFRQTIMLALVATSACVLWNTSADAYGRSGYRGGSAYSRPSALVMRPRVIRPAQWAFNHRRCIRGHTFRVPHAMERPRSHAGGTPNLTFYQPVGYYPSGLRPPRQRLCLAA